MREEQRIRILIGEFGSGKTELALNYSAWLRAQGQRTAVVDLDLVKPYFRTRESRQWLEERQVELVAPDPRYAHSDLPLLPQQFGQVAADDSCQVVIDVGGGDAAIALGQYQGLLTQQGYEAWMVVNTCRPFTQTAEEICERAQNISALARLRLSGLVCNANLGAETTWEHIEEGLPLVVAAAARLSLPVRMVVVPHWLAAKPHAWPHPLFVLQPQTHYPWMENETERTLSQ